MRKLSVVALLVAALPAAAALAVSASVEDLARGADAVVRGRVTSVTARWIGTRIFTFAEVDAASVWRGSAPPRVTVITAGGVSGRLGQRVDGAAIFAQGEEVVVFVTRAEAGAYRVTGLAQGKFAVNAGVARPDVAHTSFVSLKLKPGERPSEEMPLDELERRVRSAR